METGTDAHRDARRRHLEGLYAASPDPWDFEGSAYEREKYAATLAALPRPFYANALEVGCSIGVLSAGIAARAMRFLGLDLAEAPLARARARLAGKPGAAFRRAEVPEDWPEGRFDLIVLSEVLYFLSPDEIGRLATRAATSLAHGGDCVLVNWTGPNNGPLRGPEAAALFRDRLAGAAVLYETPLLGTADYEIRVLTIVPI